MRVGIVGAGIVGLTLARELLSRQPANDVVVLEKEAAPAQHQSSHNSGVVHAGIYYPEGSLKARLCSSGRVSMREYCREKGIPFEESGKLVVAAVDSELEGLHRIHERATNNRVPDLKVLYGDEIRQIEPHVRGSAAIHSPHTAVVDFGAVATAVAGDVGTLGGEVRLNSPVTGIERGSKIRVETGGQVETFDKIVICAGAQVDRVSKMAGEPADPMIVPFLGLYYRLRPERADLVRSLIYPVPDPRYPFLGVHLTRTVDGRVLVGPNAILSFSREGRKLGRFEKRDVADILRWKGFYQMARQNWRAGLHETRLALSKKAFLAAVQRYVPELSQDDVLPAEAGVRAQAVSASGKLVDDFVLLDRDGVLSVRNAPSPAATSSFAIAKYLAAKVLGDP